MVGGFTCARCDQLFEARPETCPACGHQGIEPLPFSDYRRRLRAGDEPWAEPLGRSRTRTAVLVVLAVGLLIVGLVAIGLGATGMVF